MALSKCKLGEHIRLYSEKNIEKELLLDSVRGISTQKKFIKTKADMNGVSLKNYKIVKPQYFAYVPDTSRRGDKISLAYNDTKDSFLVSSISLVFYVNSKVLDSEYLFMYFNRSEFDRYARFNSWGSAREAFSWEEMCDMEIELPPIEIQKKYVSIYKAMVENQKCYERGLDDLKLCCDACIEDLRRKNECIKLENFIKRYDEKNKDNKIKIVKGVSVTKELRNPTSKVNKGELKGYKIVHKGDITFVQTTHNEKVFANAINNTDNDIVVTSVNEVFKTDKEKLISEYLTLFFNRNEFDRYARFHSWGSARETFTWNDLVEVKIPIPDIKIQQDIVKIYQAYILRKEINEKLKEQIKNICPILIKGSLEEGKSN